MELLQAEVLADDLPHDLVGPAPDRAEPGVAQGSLDFVFTHVAVAAVDLDGVVGDFDQ